MVDYRFAKIYKITNSEMPEKVYYGSTCNTFKKRFRQHCSNYNKTNSKQLFEFGTPEITLVEKFPCYTKFELNTRERFYIENNKCINKVIPTRTIKEYKEDNKEKINAYRIKYNEDNKEKIKLYQHLYNKDNRERILEKKREYYITNGISIKLQKNEKNVCECGGLFTNTNKSCHVKTYKHIGYIEAKDNLKYCEECKQYVKSKKESQKWNNGICDSCFEKEV